MLPPCDMNAQSYYYRYYFYFDNENLIGTVFLFPPFPPVLPQRPEVSFHRRQCGSRGYFDRFRRLQHPQFDPLWARLWFESWRKSTLDHTVKMDSVALRVSQVLENVFFTNIVNVTHFDLQNQLLIPIVVFTDADPYSVRVSQLQQEIEETKMKIRQIFKTHLRMRRAHLVTEIVYLRNNISLLNSIQASFIDSITLLNSNNSVTYKRYRRIVLFLSASCSVGRRSAFTHSPTRSAKSKLAV